MLIIVKEGKERCVPPPRHSQGPAIQGAFVNGDSSSLLRRCVALKSVKSTVVPLVVCIRTRVKGERRSGFTEEKTKAQGNLSLAQGFLTRSWDLGGRHSLATTLKPREDGDFLAMGFPPPSACGF